MIDDAEALYELVLERRRLIRRLDELNDILFEIDMSTIERTPEKGKQCDSLTFGLLGQR
jgi:hypothetical protein